MYEVQTLKNHSVLPKNDEKTGVWLPLKRQDGDADLLPEMPGYDEDAKFLTLEEAKAWIKPCVIEMIDCQAYRIRHTEPDHETYGCVWILFGSKVATAEWMRIDNP